jgi:hypothetical protein
VNVVWAHVHFLFWESHEIWSLDLWVGSVTTLRSVQQRTAVRFSVKERYVLLPKMSMQVGWTQPPIQRYRRRFPGRKGGGGGKAATASSLSRPTSVAEVKKFWSHISTPPNVFMAWWGTALHLSYETRVQWGNCYILRSELQASVHDSDSIYRTQIQFQTVINSKNKKKKGMYCTWMHLALWWDKSVYNFRQPTTALNLPLRTAHSSNSLGSPPYEKVKHVTQRTQN